MKKGIDIYEGDNIQDWNVVKQQGIEVVIQKATQGTSHVDSLLNYRYPLIKEAGLNIGFYHFANFNSAIPVAEAQHFLNTIEGLKSDTVLWLDIEAAEKWDKQTAINYANQFINYVKGKGFEIGIYTGNSFYCEYLEGNIPDIPLWLASYGRQPSLYPSQASWQYSESGSIPGIIGDVDLDYFIENIFVKQEVKKVKNIIICGVGADERAAKYLSDHLKCPVVTRDNLTQDVLDATENVFVVGGTWKPVDKAILLAGGDRFDTMQTVLKYIGK